MEKEFWILMLRWAMVIASSVFPGGQPLEEDRHLKEQIENFIKRCEEGK